MRFSIVKKIVKRSIVDLHQTIKKTTIIRLGVCT